MKKIMFCAIMILIAFFGHSQSGNIAQKELSIPEQLMYNTIRIECLLNGNKVSVGTGFIFDFEYMDSLLIPVLVTNKHVVKGALKGGININLQDNNGSPIMGKTHLIILDSFESRWLQHPDDNVDLCILPLGNIFNSMVYQGKIPFYKSFNSTLIPSSDDLENLLGLEDLIMVGYPLGTWDSKNNLPIFRKGITASHPKIDFENKKEFLVDIACFPGSSGSPIIIYNQSSYTNKEGNNFGATRFYLLGIIYAVKNYDIKGQIKISLIPTTVENMDFNLNIPSNLGIVIKAERLLEFEKIVKGKLELK